jgi:peptidyl-prolyl cis-trans isomerase A (cyclophilin A)
MASYFRLLATIFPAVVLAQTPPAAPKPDTPPATEAPKREDGLYVTIETSMGVIQGRLFEKESPITVKNFVDLAMGRKVWTDPRTSLPVKKPLYNGLTFHRTIPNFMIQGGDPLGNGSGGTKAIPDEFHPTLKFDVPGRFGMANSGPNTGSCQFFITEVPTPHLNGGHTIFGQVTEGMDVVKAIARVPTKAENAPLKPVRIVKVSFERVGAAPVPPAKPAVKKAVSKAGTPTGAPKAAAPAKPKAAATKTK